MIAGTQHQAGTGVSTVLADMDFETYSEAGFIWDEAAKKYYAPKGATKKGLPAVGAVVYTEHPSAEVLSLAYDLKDGLGARLWTPGAPDPVDLFAHIRAGGLIEAWNCGFEYWVWTNICTPRLGWPELPHWLLRDAAAKSRAHAWPGGLDNASKVAEVPNRKIKDGKRLLNKFSIPRKPTKNDPRRRIRPEEDLVDAQLLYDYNIGDIRAEFDVSILCPDLSPVETEFWLCTQAMNVRGVQLDIKTVHAGAHVLDRALEAYNSELAELTERAASKASEVSKLMKWLLDEQGIYTGTLDAEALVKLLALPDLPAPARRALEIRQLVGSAGVKKLYAMQRMSSKAGRAHDLFIYHAARTGRDGGRDIQPQNLVKNGPKLYWCGGCGKPYGYKFEGCPHCGTMSALNKAAKWSHEAVEHAVQVIRTGRFEEVERIFGDALLTLSGCIRGMFTAKPGHELVCSDYSSIEAVVTAVLAGEQWRIEAFGRGEDIYYRGAAGVTGTTYEDYKKYEVENGHKHPDRQKIGKPAELGCFTPETQVLTNRGYSAIVDVLLTDKLWDGVEWVSHKGVVPQGEKMVIKLDGVGITPDHLVSLNGSWTAAKQLDLNENWLTQALEQGSAALPFSGQANSEEKRNTGRSRFIATAGRRLMRCRWVTYLKAPVHSAINALKKRRLFTGKCTIVTPISYPTTSTDDGSSTAFRLRLRGAITKKPNSSPPTAVVALKCSNRGGTTEGSFYSIYRQYPDGINRSFKWIGRIITEAMSRVISDSSPKKKIEITSGQYTKCKNKLTNLKNVYDIAHAGPRNRFTIKTNSGHLIVHNCGFGGWIGAWRQFDSSDNFTDEQVKNNIMAWRLASPAIVELWGGQVRGKPWAPDYSELFGLEGAAIAAVCNPGKCYSYNGITYGVKDDVLYCQLLSGRFLTYHKPRLRPSERWDGQVQLSFMGWNSNPKKGRMGWIEMATYGGSLAENTIQATARDYMGHAVPLLERAGYPVVLRVHDELVSEVPVGYGSIEEYETIMATAPPWAADWPIRAAGGWRGQRYRKD